MRYAFPPEPSGAIGFIAFFEATREDSDLVNDFLGVRDAKNHNYMVAVAVTQTSHPSPDGPLEVINDWEDLLRSLGGRARPRDNAVVDLTRGLPPEMFIYRYQPVPSLSSVFGAEPKFALTHTMTMKSQQLLKNLSSLFDAL